jgi:hypothetical protein
MKANYLLGLAIIVALGILVQPGYARIDPNSIVAMWLFDEDEDDIFVDSSENGRDAMAYGNISFVDGKYGKALELDGTVYGEVDPQLSEAFTLPVFTVAAWIGDKEVSGHQYVLCKGGVSANRNYIMNIQDATGLFVSGFSDKGGWHAVTSTTNVADGGWHHLVGTYDGKNFKVYVDGVLEKDQALAGPPMENNVPFRIGRGEGTAYQFHGLIDEIKSIMNLGLERATGLIAVFPSDRLATTWVSIRTGD